MELDSFLASPRWDILQIISKNPSSPIEIAAKIGTTVSFISQQLKLLEAAGIVSKKRTGLVEKGKPRTLFFLSREGVYVIPLSKDLPNKRFFNLSKEHKIVLKIWEIEGLEIQRLLERFFWSIEEHLDYIEGIFIYQKNRTPKIFILTKDKTIIQKIKEKHKKLSEGIDLQIVHSLSEVSKLGTEFFAPIYDPSKFFENDMFLKGGMDKNE